MTTLNDLIDHAGTGPAAVEPAEWRLAQINGVGVDLDRSVAAGDVIRVSGHQFKVVEGIGGFKSLALCPKRRISRPVRVHCGVHKALTMFSRQIYKEVAQVQRKRPFEWGWPFLPPQSRTFFHDILRFYKRQWRYSLVSISGHRLDLDSFADIRVVRFVRDPRDLLVSGYHYHKKGPQKWCAVVNPTVADFAVVNGAVPRGIAPSQSYEMYLNSVDQETGFAAELEFRRPHFDGMMSWPIDDPRVLTLRYEDIIGHEAESIGKVGDHFGWSASTKAHAMQTAWAFSAGGKEAVKGHIRNKAPGQWRGVVPKAVNDAVVQRYEPFLKAFDYPLD